jgi:preprotein translocase subunit SecY
MTAFSIDGFGSRGPDLRHRIYYTLLLLLLFRVLADIPVLHVDEERLHHLLADNPLVGTVDLFAGGEVMSHFSIVAAGIFPYLMALALVQLGTWVVPSLRELRDRGEQGKKRIELLAKVLTIPLAFLFAWALSQYLSQQTGLFPGHIHWFTAASFLPSLGIVCLVTLGSLVSTAIAHLITKKGLGQGEDVILLGGSSLVLCKQIVQAIRQSPDTAHAWQRLGWIAVGGLAVVVLGIYAMGTVRSIPVQYAKRQVSTSRLRKASNVSQLRLPLISGRILPISAAIGVLTLLQLPQGFLRAHADSRLGALGLALTGWATPSNGWYWLVFAGFMVLFTYVYNFSVISQPTRGDSIADSLKKQGAYIPGLRPGLQTQAYLSRIVASISLPGGVALAFLAAGVPYIVLRLTHQNVMVTVLSLLVVVLTIEGLQDEFVANKLMESYEGFLSSPWRRGRLR